MLTLTRQGLTPTRAQGLVDNLTLTYNGNQLKKVSDQISNAGLAGSMDFKDYADGEIEYSFNMNGAMTSDLNKGITSIAYNYLNLPQEIVINQTGAQRKAYYTYSATGQKLRVVREHASVLREIPITGLSAMDVNQTDSVDYVGNFIYENDSLKRILVEGGYIEGGNYYFYITDHLGNNRIVADANGEVVQSNEYYPFGLLMATSTEADKQPYKYGNKELDSYNGLNLYDFEARYFDGVRFTTPDPHAEKYFSWSPYAYVMNNPLKYIDPFGTDTVPSNETWEYELINYRSDGASGTYETDKYRRANNNGDIFHLHLITTGENEGNYLAIQQYGKDEKGYDLYEYQYVVGKDKLEDFINGETKGTGYLRDAVKLAVDGGMDGRASFADNALTHLKNQWKNPLNVIFDITASNPYNPADWMGSPNNWLFKGKQPSSIKGNSVSPRTWNQFQNQRKGMYTKQNYGNIKSANKAKSRDYRRWKK